MKLTSRMKMARSEALWIEMRKHKPLDESRKSGQTPGTKMAFNSKKITLLLASFEYHNRVPN
ncbi:hypothetical protein Hanom_Chr07g00637151 [Helianthus anomalus]